MAIIQKNMNCILNQGARKTKLAFLAEASANNGGLKMQFFFQPLLKMHLQTCTLRRGGGGEIYLK